jgi:outer membrane receptor protein involved in Fe transport
MTLRIRPHTFLLVAVVVLGMAAAAAADTGGRLSGTVSDTDGASLPGVTVTVSSPSLIGTRTEVTDSSGQYLFPDLPPGDYSLRAELEGFVTVEQAGVVVRLDRTAVVDVALGQGSVSEEITVTEELPIIDPQQTPQGQVFQQEFLEKASVGSGGRDYLDVIGQAAGVAGTGNVRVFGSTAAENAFLIDGVTTTDPVTSTFGTNFNYDAIREISFITGGYKAEYGGATGGVVNLITKSGGNDFSGSFDVRYRDTDFTENGDHFEKRENRTKFVQPGATLGGPILRDRIWFFASYEDIDSEATPTGAPTTFDFEGQNYLAKVTWRLADSADLVAKVSGDPAEIDNSDASRFIAPEAGTKQEQGGTLSSAALAWTVGPNSLLDVTVGIMRQELNAFPQSGDFNTPSILDLGTNELLNNGDNVQLSDRDRDELRATWEQFFGSDHSFKGGVEYNDLAFKTQNYTTGGLQYNDVFGVPFILFDSGIQGPLTFDGTRQTAFLQDTWQIGDRLSVDLGVRYDEVAYDNEEGAELTSLDQVQPRLGFAWDATGDARTVVRGYYGRFMHPSALSLPSFLRTATVPTELWVSCANGYGAPTALCRAVLGEPHPDPLDRDPSGYFLDSIFSSQPSVIGGDLDPMYADSWSIGVERQIGRRTSVEISYVEKETKDIFEDTCDGNFPAVGASESCDFYVFANLPGLSRKYEGILVRAESRMFDWLHLVGSYTNSRSRGSIDDTQNAGSDFDFFPIHFVNRFGYMPDDRRHRFKVNGFVDLPMDFGIGIDAFWSSEFAYDVVVNADPYGLEFIEARGSRRANENYGLNVDLRKAFQVGDDLRFELIATVNNVFDDEQVTAVCEDLEGCGGTIDLGDPTTFGRPRSYEAGFRVTFR